MPAAEAMLMMHPPPIGEARVGDWASEGNASTVDGDVQTAPLGENPGHRCLPVRLRGYIQPEGECLASTRADRVGDLSRIRFVQVGQGDPCPCLCKTLGSGVADAGGRARHEGDFADHALGAEHICHVSWMPRERGCGESALLPATSANARPRSHPRRCPASDPRNRCVTPVSSAQS